MWPCLTATWSFWGWEELGWLRPGLQRAVAQAVRWVHKKKALCRILPFGLNLFIFFLNKNHLWPQLCFFLTVSLFSILSLDTSIPPFLPFCHYWLVTTQSTHLSFFPWSFLHPEPPLPPTPPHCVAAAQHHLQQMHEQDLLVVQVLFLLSVLHCISIVVHWVAFVTLDLFSLPSQGQNRWTARCACGYTTNTCSCCFLLHLLRFRCTWSQILLLLVILLLVVIGVSGKPVQVCCMCKPVFPKQARWA